MFKKPLSHVKTSAPLRSSDRRKLRQRVQDAYHLSQEDADALVPDGVMSLKFMTHVDAQGVAYVSPDGEPLWFTVGKSADDPLLPSVYTLWKKQDLLPFVSTPAAVLPILVGGADLMVPGVVHVPPALASGQLVCVRQYISRSPAHPTTTPALSAPVAVGRLALSSDALRDARASEDTNRGKAVHVVHTWKDHLWEMGSGKKGGKATMPVDTPLQVATKEGAVEEAGEVEEGASEEAAVEVKDEDADEEEEEAESSRAASPPPSSSSPLPSSADPTQPDAPRGVTYTPAEVSALLELALIQAIATRLSPSASSSSNEKATFPIPATRFYTDFIIPCRPGLPTRLVPPSSGVPQPSSTDTNENENENSSSNSNTNADDDPPTILTPLAPKSSSYKSLAAFLRAMEKSGLISLKHTPKQDPLVTAVHPAHSKVLGHTRFVTEAQVLAARRRAADARAAALDEGQGRAQGGKDALARGAGVRVREVWAPEGAMKGWFERLGISGSAGSSSADAEPDLDRDDDPTRGMYTAAEIKNGLSVYVARAGLANRGDPAYVNLDEVLLGAVGASGSGSSEAKKKAKAKGKDKAGEDKEEDKEEEGPLRWLRRDELARRVMASKKLQAWHEIRTGGRAGTRAQGVLLRKGPLHPISVTCKTRAGRKVVTSVAGFEPFLSLPYLSPSGPPSGGGNTSSGGQGTEAETGAAGIGGRGVSAEEMAEDLRKLCAGATTVGPTQTGGFKLPNGALSQTVTVQGRQGKAVLEYLVAKGVPKEWVSVDAKDLK